jgi:hypothetical protein
MKKEIAMKWVKALRSGKYVQATGRLAREGNQRCCLGVLRDVVGSEEYAGCSVLWNETTEKCGLNVDRYFSSQGALADLNDSGEASFNDIADLIEVCWREL